MYSLLSPVCLFSLCGILLATSCMESFQRRGSPFFGKDTELFCILVCFFQTQILFCLLVLYVVWRALNVSNSWKIYKKKASILIHLQNHHSEDKTFLFVCFPRTTRSLYFFYARKINNFNSSVSYWVFWTKNVHWWKITQIPRNQLLYLQAYE